MPTLVVVVPHPDDESYAFAGTIALATAAGWRCIVHCVTSGEGGTRFDGGPPGAAALAATREQELAASCALLGAEPPFSWRLPDGGLAGWPDQYARAAALLSRGSDVVLTLGSDGAYGHPDHIAVHRWIAAGWHALGAGRPALLFAAFPRGLFLPQYELCIELMGDPPSPPAASIGSDHWDVEVDVRGVAATKEAAVRAHRSQLPGGDPAALFPPGVLAGCMEFERFTLAPGSPSPPASFPGHAQPRNRLSGR